MKLKGNSSQTNCGCGVSADFISLLSLISALVSHLEDITAVPFYDLKEKYDRFVEYLGVCI